MVKKNLDRSLKLKVIFGLFLCVSIGAFIPFRISLNFTVAEDPSSTVGETLGDFIVEDQPVFEQLPIEPGMGERYIIVSIADQRLQAYDRGEKIFDALISSGREGRETPKGEFTIRNKHPRAYSKVAHLYMPYWMAFHHDGQYWLGFHELPEWSDGTKEGQEHLGQAYSGGCIRLGVGAAEFLYDWAQVGDRVLVY